jgi:hypothetical protein
MSENWPFKAPQIVISKVSTLAAETCRYEKYWFNRQQINYTFIEPFNYFTDGA